MRLLLVTLVAGVLAPTVSAQTLDLPLEGVGVAGVLSERDGVTRPAEGLVDLAGVDPHTGPLAAWLARNGLAAPSSEPVDAGEPASLGADAAALEGGNIAIATFRDAVSVTESLDSASLAYNPRRLEYLVVWHAFVRSSSTNIYGQRRTADGAAVGEPFVICAAPGAQVAPSVGYDSTGDQYWVAWTDFRSGGRADVYLRRVSPDGALIASEIQANSGTNDAFAARLAVGPGRCVVVWANDPHDGNAHILGRAYNWLGSAVTQALLLSEPVGKATEPDVCFDPEDAHFLVVWHESHGGNWDVWMHRLSNDLYGMGRVAVATAQGNQQAARVAYSPAADAYLVAWQDGRSLQTWDIYSQRIGRNGAPQGGALNVFSGAYHDMAPAVAGHAFNPEFLVTYQRDISGAQQFEIFASRVQSSGVVGASFEVYAWYNVRTRPAVAQRPTADEYMLVWTDNGAATQPDILVRRMRPNGDPSSSVLTISRGRKGQEAPAAAHGTVRDEVLVAWADYRSGSDYDLYARRISAATNTYVGGEIVLGNTADLYGEPAVAYDPAVDEYLVVWQEVTSPASGYEIYARRLGGGGELRGSAFRVSVGTNTVNEGRPHVAFSPASGEYLVVWHAFTNGLWRIWAQRVAASGALLGSNVTLSSSTADTQNPRVAHNRQTNQFLAVWQDGRNGRTDIYGQRWAGGAYAGGNLAIATGTGNKGRCDLAHDAGRGTYLVAWGDSRTGGNDIYARRFDGTGAPVGQDFAVAATSLSEIAPSVAFDPTSGQYLVAWWEYRDDTDYDIGAQAVSDLGVPVNRRLQASTVLEVQSRVQVVQNALLGRLLLVWQDFRGGSYDVYGQWWTAPRGRLVRRNLDR